MRYVTGYGIRVVGVKRGKQVAEYDFQVVGDNGATRCGKYCFDRRFGVMRRIICLNNLKKIYLQSEKDTENLIFEYKG